MVSDKSWWHLWSCSTKIRLSIIMTPLFDTRDQTIQWNQQIREMQSPLLLTLSFCCVCIYRMLHSILGCDESIVAFAREGRGVLIEWWRLNGVLRFVYSMFRLRRDCQRPNLLFYIPRAKNRRTGYCIRFVHAAIADELRGALDG